MYEDVTKFTNGKKYIYKGNQFIVEEKEHPERMFDMVFELDNLFYDFLNSSSYLIDAKNLSDETKDCGVDLSKYILRF